VRTIQDGGRVAYARERDIESFDHSEIRIVSRDGMNLGNMDSHFQDNDGYPAWSPDGRRLLFIRDAALEPNGQATRLVVADVRTGRVRVIADFPYRGSASWRPR
jgi:Tol biopolymer transport system component